MLLEPNHVIASQLQMLPRCRAFEKAIPLRCVKATDMLNSVLVGVFLMRYL